MSRFLAIAVPCLLVASVQAQSFNINFDTSSASTLPTSYGGKAGQAGKWNMIDLNSTAAQSIKLLNGNTAGCLSIKPSVALSTMTWPDPKTCGTIEKLLDSFAQVPATGADVEISGLTPGSYSVWVYARHPISCWYSCTSARWTKISVNGSTLSGSVGGGGGNCSVLGHIDGLTYRSFTVTVNSTGKLKVHLEPSSSSPAGAINGLQVKCLAGGTKCYCGLTSTPVVAQLYDGSGGLPIGDNPVHQLQVHAEMKGTAEAIIGQAHRRDARAPHTAGATARKIDLEVWAGEGSLSSIDPVFSKNYSSAPTNVIKRKTVSLPDWSAVPRQSPAPFDFVLKYDQPFRYSGQGDFVWEMISYTRSTVGHPADAEFAPTSRPGSYGTLGTGCTTAGMRSPIDAALRLSTQSVQQQKATWSMGGSVRNAAPGGVCGFLFGFTNPAFPFPFSCRDAHLYTDATFQVQGKADAQGSYSLPAIAGPWISSYAGVNLFSQAVSISQGRLLLSNGVVSPMPGLPQPGPYAWVRASSTTATQGTVATGAAMVTKILR